MADELPTDAEQDAVSVNASSVQDTPPADDYDKDRAMATIAKLRSFEKDAKAKLRRLEELEAQAREQTDKQLSESQRLQKQLAELQTAHAAAQATIRRATLLEGARSAASKAGLDFHDGALTDALALGAFDALEVDELGTVKEMPEAVKRLAKERPYLLKPAAQSADLDGARRGTITKADDESDKRKRLALRLGIRNAG